MYSFLMKQYPGSRYRGEVLLSVAKIQNDNLNKPEDAEATYKQYLKLFHAFGSSCGGSRAALNEIERPRRENGGAAAHAEAAADRAAGVDKPQPRCRHGPSVKSNCRPNPNQNEVVDKAAKMLPVDAPQVTPKAVDDGLPVVKDFKTWNSPDSARIVVNLGNTVEFKSARIASPERIYFDLHKAQLGPKAPRQPVNIEGGMLKTIRVAQNKPDTVRLVLDVDGAKNYSAFLVANPYRLVIDLQLEANRVARRGCLCCCADSR